MLSGDRDAMSSVLVDASIARQMSDMIRAFRISQIVGTIAQLGIPDRLASGARTAGELASLIGCHAGATHRLMRAASDLGLVASGSDARFTLTGLGQSLRSDVPGSVRDSAIALTSPGHWLPWGRLSAAVRTGRRQTAETLGAELFEYYSDSPAEGRAFTGAMSVSSMEVAGEVARVLDTSSAKLVVDVGGASGALISTLLMKNPALTGAILERPEVPYVTTREKGTGLGRADPPGMANSKVPRAQAAVAERGPASRCRVFEGNFFLSVPKADIFVLKHIIHDCDDDQSVLILELCASAATERTGCSRRTGAARERLRERSITRGFEYARFTPGTRTYPTRICRFDLSCRSSARPRNRRHFVHKRNRGIGRIDLTNCLVGWGGPAPCS
jgi:hypothetical protein